MKKLLGKILQNQFLTSSLVMIIGTNFYNFGQFIYHFITGRMLGRTLYSDLATIISILGLMGIIQLSLNLTIVKYIASRNQKQEISNFIKWVELWTIWIAIVLALILFLLSPFLIRFLNINSPATIYLLPIVMLFFILANTTRSILQGLVKFKLYIISLLSESVIKIILTIILIYLGYAVFGAMIALIIAVAASYLVARFSLAAYFKGKRGDLPQIAPLLKYSSATFIQGLAMTSMYSTDLLLVKHFFPADQAGLYAALAVLGRIVFFGVSPITNVMFPLVAGKFERKQNYLSIFLLSLFLVGLICFVIVVFYIFFSSTAIKVLYGPTYLEGAPYLWWFGLFMSLLALAMFLTQFYLSLAKTKTVFLFLLAALLQVVLIWFNHSSILIVIQMSILSSTLLVVALLVYFPYHKRSLNRDDKK